MLSFTAVTRSVPILTPPDNVCPRPPVTSPLRCPQEASIISPALRTLGNIVTGSDAQTDTVVKAGAMRYFPRLLAHSKANVVKEAAWTISNVTAGNLQQIQAVIDAGLLGPVLEVLQKVGGRCGDGGGGRGGG